MNHRNYIKDSAAAFKVVVNTSDPILLIAEGLSAAEEIVLSVLNDGSLSSSSYDPTNDSIWGNLSEDSANISLSVATNNLFIQAPGVYRLELAAPPATPVTIVGFTYG